MTLLTVDSTPIQERILQQNFDRSGPFFISRDLHAMLDCANSPELALVDPATGDGRLPAGATLGIPFDAKLREEFFGGILFDRRRHRHFMLDHEAYALLDRMAGAQHTEESLLADVGTATAADTLRALVRQGLVGPADPAATVTRFPARDLSLPYLQSPIIVEVEVTYGCFRACRHCAYESAPDARMPDELTAEEWGGIFTKLADAGTLIIQLTGGDPLYRDDSFDIVDAADRAGMSVYVRSDTAALSPKNVERLRSVRNLWHIGTSIDGADAAMHDWMRGRGAFEVLAKRIGVLADAGIPIAAGATLHRDNYTTVRRIGQVATGFGARWFDIGLLSPVGRAASMADLVLDEEQTAEAMGLYLDGIRAGDYAPSHAHWARRAHDDAPFDDLAPLMGKLPYVTEWPFSRLRLDPRGSSYTAGKLKGSDFSGGFKLTETSVEHVWDTSPNLVQLREFGQGGRIHSLDYRLLRSNHEFM